MTDQTIDQSPSGEEPYLVVEDLTVKFPTEDGLVSAVNDLSYTLELGKTLANDLLPRLAGGDASGLDGSTAGLLARLRRGP